MGNEESTMKPQGPPVTLAARSLQAVADHIKDGKAKRIVVMTGAGISTAAGIPDFRSPGTGLYANLARLDLPYAEAVFDIDFFRKRPEPFYYLAKELYPGKFHPTLSHAFIALLARKDLLAMNFTQNIDCLERRAGVPADLIVEAHGSFATQRCVECRTPFPDAEMRDHVEAEIVPRCVEDRCGGLVKPDIVFFGEALPSRFRDESHRAAAADLVIVLGTSLSVYPFAGLPEHAVQGVPRVLFNKERVGLMGVRSDDVLELGACDAGVRKLAAMLGWEDELEALWRDVVGDEEAERQLARAGGGVEDEVAKLTAEVESALTLESRDETDADKEAGSEDEGAAKDARPGGEEIDTAEAGGQFDGVATSKDGFKFRDGVTEAVRQPPMANDGSEAATGSREGEGGEGSVHPGPSASVISEETPESQQGGEEVKAGGEEVKAGDEEVKKEDDETHAKDEATVQHETAPAKSS